MALNMDRFSSQSGPGEANKPKATFFRMLKFLVPYKWSMVCVLVSLGLVSGATVILIWGFQNLIDKALIKGNFHQLNYIILFFIGIGFARFFGAFFAQYLMSKVGQHILEEWRNKLFIQLQKLNLSYFDKTHTGELQSKVSNDLSVIQGFVRDTVHSLISIPLSTIMGVGLLIKLSPQLTFVSLFVLPVMGYMISWGSKRMKKLAHKQQERVSDLTVVFQEAITGIRVIRGFAQEEQIIKKFMESSQKSFQAAMRGYLLQSLIKPGVELFGVFGLCMVIYVGGRLVVIDKSMTSGQFVAFLLALGNMIAQLSRIGGTLLQLQYTLASGERLFQILDTKPDFDESLDALEAKPFVGEVSFHSVYFSYSEKDDFNNILNNINFKVEPGKIVAIVGPTGSGKSTFVNLIPRFYDIKKGEIKIDGTNIKNFTLNSLRKQIGIVPQDTLLFSTSIKENIGFSKPGAFLDEIKSAAQSANASEFIDKLPNGYDTLVGERGVLLSGGQRQRISIARAILANPRILILDEATSALDSQSEKLVQEALERLMQKRTTFVIAHRLSTIRNADLILVLDKGSIIEQGNHDQLLAQGGLYHRLVSIQSGVIQDS